MVFLDSGTFKYMVTAPASAPATGMTTETDHVHETQSLIQTPAMNMDTVTDTGMTTETDKVANTVTDTKSEMNMATNMDREMQIDTDTNTDMVIHGYSHGGRIRGSAYRACDSVFSYI